MSKHSVPESCRAAVKDGTCAEFKYGKRKSEEKP